MTENGDNVNAQRVKDLEEIELRVCSYWMNLLGDYITDCFSWLKDQDETREEVYKLLLVLYLIQDEPYVEWTASVVRNLLI